MTDDERLNPTWKSSIVEWGKIAGAMSAIVGVVILGWGMTFGPLGSWLADVEEMRARQIVLLDRMEAADRTSAETTAAIASVALTLAELTEAQTANITRITRLEEGRRADTSPAIRFARRGHSIEDGAPGDTVQITWSFFKLRDCNIPTIDLFLRNGDARVHRFENVSVLDEQGRGIAVEPDPTVPQPISYTARIPADDGVRPGPAVGWVRVAYPSCPGVVAVTSPEQPFQILE